MSFEPVSAYPKLKPRHALYGVLWATACGMVAGLILADNLADGEGLLRAALSALVPAFYGPGLPLILFADFSRPKVRIGPDWIESYSDHLEALWREELDDLVALLHESDREVIFELRDGRDFTIRRKHVGRGSWDELRAELAYRLDFYEAPEPRRSRLDAFLERA